MTCRLLGERPIILESAVDRGAIAQLIESPALAQKPQLTHRVSPRFCTNAFNPSSCTLHPRSTAESRIIRRLDRLCTVQLHRNTCINPKIRFAESGTGMVFLLFPVQVERMELVRNTMKNGFAPGHFCMLGEL